MPRSTMSLFQNAVLVAWNVLEGRFVNGLWVAVKSIEMLFDTECARRK